MNSEFDYKPNSHKSKEEQKNQLPEPKKIEKVVTGNVMVKKKSGVAKLADVFLPEDIPNVKNYIIMDVIIPTLKDALEDVVHMILRGESGRRKSSSAATKVSYRSYYDNPSNERRYNEPKVRPALAYEDFRFESRGDAEMVLDRMCELIETYGKASVADLYDLCEKSDDNYMNNKYGWVNLNAAEVIRTRDGYAIKMPRAMPLN